MADEATPKALLRECERVGLNPVSLRAGRVWGGLPQKIFKFGCFLLQSRQSSALFPGLVT